MNIFWTGSSIGRAAGESQMVPGSSPGQVKDEGLASYTKFGCAAVADNFGAAASKFFLNNGQVRCQVT